MRRIVLRIIPVLMLALLATPAALMEGCGSDEYCGGCPSDSVAPNFSVINMNNQPSDRPIDIVDGGSPVSLCWNDVTFWATDQFGNKLDGICMEIFSDGFLKPAKSLGGCTDNTGEYVSGYLRTRSDAGGVVKVDFATPLLTCADLGIAAGESRQVTYFVQASSCQLGTSAKVTITYNCI